MPVSEHFSELYKIIRISVLAIIFTSFFLSFHIDKLIQYWLENIGLDIELLELSIYSPYDWINTKWAILLIFSISIVSPISCIKLRNFASSGLYPREQKWLSIILFSSGLLLPLIMFIIWFLVIPFSINYFSQMGTIDGIVAKYDVVSIIHLGIGISWVFVIGISTFVVLSLSRIFGIVEDNESRIRIRVILISSSIIFLTLPKTYDGVRVFIALSTIFIADFLSRLTPIYE
ncbi:twin-arginine translocase subunit TatC [Euryarchaeota archaeon]|jgi:Sec-independent protein secretion pathway component TatC|nr:twin-arginine translocase subunit TatC [Euryarchaeota archaeon]|tara:strand:+ start:1199 stop:1894 length:696 start_codon:yes stop_codon:yes gene_type:complete